MNTHPFRTLILAVALSLSATVVARPALARTSLPSDPVATRKVVEKRVTAVWSAVERKLDGRHVSSDRKKDIRRMFDDAAKPVFEQLDRASADGTISKEEANRLRTLISGLRGSLRERLAVERKAARSGAAPSPRDGNSANVHGRKSSAPAADAATQARSRPNTDTVEDSEQDRPAPAVRKPSRSHR
jgi:hypothetical protein